ncbi:MAG: hypothetical protein H6502_02980 [Candidatus Woesearchaeota archaeon]|nr:MAG: hypothetical protein H6502_02980 [Candidatus Woesearchaeota archaeon]
MNEKTYISIVSELLGHLMITMQAIMVKQKIANFSICGMLENPLEISVTKLIIIFHFFPFY